MKVELLSLDGAPVVIDCEDTDELAAIIDVLQERGLLPPAPDDDEEADDLRKSAAGVTDDDMVDGQERLGA